MDQQSLIPITMAVAKAGLSAGTTTTITTTATVPYAIRGKAYSKAALTNSATPTTDYATGNAFLPVMPNFGSIFAVGFDSAGTTRVVQGTIVPLDTNGNFINAPQFGAFGPSGSGSNDNNFCPIGYIVIQAGATASVNGWIFGTSNLSAATGITYTFVDVMTLPDRPQVS